MWSIGSSPPSTKMKNSSGNLRAIFTTRREPTTAWRGSFGTVPWPARPANSWNIRECCASSMTSWYTYRSSGDPAGSVVACSSRPRLRTPSKK